MVTLLLRENDIPELTAFSGNIDVDSLKPHIYNAQINDLKRVLGKDLYDKILADYVAGTLADVYLTIYTDYVIDMLTYFSCTNYMAFGGYKTANAGIFKTNSAGGTSVDIKEVNILINRYRELAVGVEHNFLIYMTDIDIPEFSESSEINKTNIIPWY